MNRVLEDSARSGPEVVLRVEKAAAPAGNRLVALDALRGVAIALVIFHHVWFRFPEVHYSNLGKFVAGIGWAGVDLFFAISGFLITTILLRSPIGMPLRAFYIKRFFRIIPIYMLAVALYVLAAVLVGQDGEIIHRIWLNVVLLTAWAIPFLGENGVPYTITWSVSVEEFAYILLGAMLFVNRGGFSRGLRWVVVSALVLRIASIAIFAFEPITLYYFAPGRVDGIAMGGVFATLRPSVVRRIAMPSWVPWLVWFGVVAACSLFKRESVVVATIGYTAIACASAWLVLCVANGSSSRSWVVTGWLASFGLVSYFIYLFHGFVIGALAAALPPNVANAFGVWFISGLVALLTFLAAKVSWHLVEYPFIQYGRQLASRYEAEGA